MFHQEMEVLNSLELKGEVRKTYSAEDDVKFQALIAEVTCIKDMLVHLTEKIDSMTSCQCIKTSTILTDSVTGAETEEILDVKENTLLHKSDTATNDLHVETQVIDAVKDEEILNQKHLTDKEISVHDQTEVKEPVEAPIYHIGKKTKRRLTDDIETEYLGKALQENIVTLVENMQFSSSGLCDLLVGNDCLTGDECAALNSLNAKDQIRNTVRLMKGRSNEVLKKFLNCVQKFHPDVTEIIWETFKEKKKKNHISEKLCVFCKLKRAIDVRYIADFIWGVEGISDDVYADIVSHTRHDISDSIKWERLADACNKSENKKILKTIIHALQRKGYYSHLIPCLKRETELVCRCANVTEIRKNLCKPFEITDDERTTLSPVSSDEDELLDSFPEFKDIGSSENSLNIDEESRYNAIRAHISHILSDAEDCLALTKKSNHIPRMRSHSFGKGKQILNANGQRRASCF